MKNLLIIGFATLSLAACQSNKTAVEPETLPKDIALKPDNNLSQQQDKEKLTQLIKEIETMATAQTCTNASDWKFTAIGSKPCGGPSSYIAYPAQLEETILPKIQNFTELQSAFNKKYGLISDCAMVMPPTGIVCENGKAVLVGANTATSQVQ
ncbi:hypothetical protein [Kaistella montana]|uniref:Uncharacterized protein n=1 Tax=Kaistella montana TaxID=1849733 RepID=A0ABW5K888_9FLAO|nr:hypothetical protein [Kaistella montana]MCQ4035431.1 hypothetical protein [Kaistella montana]